MSVQVEKLENSTAKLTIEVSAENFEAAMQKAYLKVKGNIQLQGFRKGHAPRAMVEKMYGPGVFYEDAANFAMQEAYPKAAEEADVTITSHPEIDIVQIEKGKPFIFTATVATKPEVTLGQYKGLEVEEQDVQVTEEEIEAELKKTQEKNAREIHVEDRPVADGDTAVIDFEGFVDGVAFDGGKGENFDLVIGSHSFIDNFEEQLIGKNIGEEVEVHVTFPDPYQAKELAGKPALFKVTVKAIRTKELPELDDEFASEVSDFETLGEYKASVKTELSEKKEKEAQTKKENEAVEKAVANATMQIADLMIQTEAERMVDEFGNRLQQQGLTMEQYMQYTGMDQKSMADQMKPQAEERIRTRLVLEAIVSAENIEASDEEVEEEIKKMAENYKLEESAIKEYLGDAGIKSMKMDLAVQKAVTLLADTAVETEKKAEEEAEDK